MSQWAGSDTRYVPIARKDLPLLLGSAVALLATGLFVAVVLVFLLPGDDSPDESEPVQIGLASSIHQNVEEDGPYFQADPLRGERPFWVALEDGEIVALAIDLPGEEGCIVDYQSRDETFVDCRSEPVLTEALARYDVTISADEKSEGAVLVDLQTLLPAPEPDPAT